MGMKRRSFLKGLGLSAFAASGALAFVPEAEAVPDLVPDGWLVCNGQAVSRSVYPDLFRAIGTAHGGGSDTFSLPDLRFPPMAVSHEIYNTVHVISTREINAHVSAGAIFQKLERA